MTYGALRARGLWQFDLGWDSAGVRREQLAAIGMYRRRRGGKETKASGGTIEEIEREQTEPMEFAATSNLARP
jgi:hypothetical protein